MMPLAGRTVLVTRARAQAAELAQRLTERGARVVEFPAIRFAEPETWAPIDDGFARASRDHYDWIVFTSANGVRFVADHFAARGVALRDTLGRARLAAIGPATAAALDAVGVTVHRLPAEFRAESVVDAFAAESLTGVRILLARAEVARDILPRELRARGAFVDVCVAYRTLSGDADVEPVRAALEKGEIDAVTFASSSTVHNVIVALGSGARAVLERAAIVCIGPITADTVRAYGLPVRAEARAFTIPGLVDAVVETLSPPGRGAAA